MLHPFDYAVIAIFFAALVGIGWFFRRFGGDSNQYFRGGGRMSWWLVGTSAFMGAFSAWTFTGAAGLAFDQGLVVLAIYWAGAFGFFCNWAGFAAWLRQTRVITSMEASSGYTTTSSAPASMAASVMASSSAPGA